MAFFEKMQGWWFKTRIRGLSKWRRDLKFVYLIRKIKLFLGFSRCGNCNRKLGRIATIIDGKRVCENCVRIQRMENMIKLLKSENNYLTNEINEMKTFQTRFGIFKPVIQDIIAGKYIKIDMEDNDGRRE